MESIFHCLNESGAARLDGAKVPHAYKKGQIIFYEGNPAFALYCINSGKVKLYKMRTESEPHVIRILGPGEVMGYRALFANEPYAATAEAVETTTVCAIAKETLLDLLHQSPELALRFLSKLSQELRISEEQILSVARDSVQQRTARVLLSFIDASQKPVKSPALVRSSLSRAEMAQVIATTPETFSRTLHGFARRRILRLVRSEIYVLDLQRLQQIAKSPEESVDLNQEDG